MNLKTVTAMLLACGAQFSSAQTVRMGMVTLASPTDQTLPMVIDGLVWRCSGSSCTGPAGNGRAGDQHVCHDLAKKVGIVASYAGTRGNLTTEELARCNRGIGNAP